MAYMDDFAAATMDEAKDCWRTSARHCVANGFGKPRWSMVRGWPMAESADRSMSLIFGRDRTRNNRVTAIDPHTVRRTWMTDKLTAAFC